MSDARQTASQAPDIVVVTHFYPAHGGGIELVASRLVHEYLEAGRTVEWFASATDSAPPGKPGLRLHPVPASNIVERLTQLPYPLWSPSVMAALWRSIGRARAVHVHEHLYMGSLLAIVIGRLRRKRVVLTQHMGALNLPTRWTTALYKAASKTIAWPTMRLASEVAFVSANVQEFFFSGNKPQSRSRLLFNGLDGSTFAFADSAHRSRCRSRLGLRTDEQVAIFAGRFVRKKGLPFLRQLAARTPEIKWLFAGSGPIDPSDWHLGNVICLGRISQKDLAAALMAADVLVLPSYGEGFPLVVQEALACGTAVLSTHEVRHACPGATEMIEEVDLHDGPEDLANWDSALRAIMAARADESARSQRATRSARLWSWPRCSDEYLQRLGLRQNAGNSIS